MRELRRHSPTGTSSATSVAVPATDLEHEPRDVKLCRPLWLSPLALADVVGLLIAFGISEGTAPVGSGGRLTIPEEALVLLATVPCWIVVASLHGLYAHEDRADHATTDELAAIFHLTTVGTGLLGILLWTSGLAHPDVSKLVVFWLTATASISLARAATRALIHRRRSRNQNVVIYGAGTAGQLVARKLLSHPEYGWNLLCFVDPEPIGPSSDLVAIPVLQRLESLWDLTRRLQVDRVIFAYSRTRDAEQLDVAHALRAVGIHVDVVPRMYEIMDSQADLLTVEALPLLSLGPIARPHGGILKRAVDLSVASIALLVLLPLLALVALLIKLDSRGPIVFRSERVGAAGRRFALLKFRTMSVDAEDELSALLESASMRAEYERSHKLLDDPRVTRVGRWLRRASLDEMPQLVNILRGELSLVGPRPITIAEYKDFVSASEGNGSWSGVDGYWAIPNLRPGLTGLWQINGRSAMSYEERVRLDKLYAANWSMKLDLLILAKTVRSVFSAAGAH